MSDHREHDGTDLDTLCGLYDSVRELRTHRDRLVKSSEKAMAVFVERDRLRDELACIESDRHHWISELEGKLGEITDERDRLRADVKVQTDAADAAAEAVGAMAEKLTAVMAERDRLREEILDVREAKAREEVTNQELRIELEALRAGGRDLVAAAEAWRAAYVTLTEPTVRRQVVDALVAAVDALDRLSRGDTPEDSSS